MIHGRQERGQSDRQEDHSNAEACPRVRAVSQPQMLVWRRTLGGVRPENPDIVDVFRANSPMLHYLGTGSLVGWVTCERLRAADGAVRFRV